MQRQKAHQLTMMINDSARAYNSCKPMERNKHTDVVDRCTSSLRALAMTGVETFLHDLQALVRVNEHGCSDAPRLLFFCLSLLGSLCRRAGRIHRTGCGNRRGCVVERRLGSLRGARARRDRVQDDTRTRGRRGCRFAGHRWLSRAKPGGFRTRGRLSTNVDFWADQ